MAKKDKQPQKKLGDMTPQELMVMMSQKARPNPLQAIGAGMSGFAAPFLGQSWSNPYAAKSGSGGSMSDMVTMMMMQKMLRGDTDEYGGTVPPENAPPTPPGSGVPGVPGMPGTPKMPLGSDIEAFLQSQGRPGTGGPGQGPATVAGANPWREATQVRKSLMGQTTRTNLETLSMQEEIRARIQSDKEVTSEQAKHAQEMGRDYLRATGALDTTYDYVFKFNQEQHEKFGVKPGQFFGLIDKMTPEQWNQYKTAAEASSKEAASLVGRLLIPAVRGAYITEIFAGSTATVGNTIEANATNLGETASNNLVAALSSNIMVVDDATGKIVPIQTVTIDEKTGKPLSQLNLRDKTRAMNEIKRKQGEMTRQFHLTQAYDRNPELLDSETVKELVDGAPKFKNEDAVWEALKTGKVYYGALVNVDGQIGVLK